MLQIILLYFVLFREENFLSLTTKVVGVSCVNEVGRERRPGAHVYLSTVGINQNSDKCYLFSLELSPHYAYLFFFM